ncbi:MAG: DNA repair protein RadC [Oscillospiraceae bacterium]|nr:DNA repair protein RadC [Oscillospiraceae bacterium]
MGVHNGHRDRKREQFLRCGAESFADHELLEMLLYYAIPQRDTNPIAHSLMERFGSLQAVLSAPPEELMEVPYIKEKAAVLLRLAPALYQRVLMGGEDREVILDTRERVGEFFRGLFMTHTAEVMYQLCLDGKGKKKSLHKLSEGDVGSVGVNIRQIVENALRSRAAAVVLAHNHPSGVALPSHEDQIATRMAAEALGTVGVRLADHIIVADNDYVSMAESGLL